MKENGCTDNEHTIAKPSVQLLAKMSEEFAEKAAAAARLGDHHLHHPHYQSAATTATGRHQPQDRSDALNEADNLSEDEHNEDDDEMADGRRSSNATLAASAAAPVNDRASSDREESAGGEEKQPAGDCATGRSSPHSPISLVGRVSVNEGLGSMLAGGDHLKRAVWDNESEPSGRAAETWRGRHWPVS